MGFQIRAYLSLTELMLGGACLLAVILLLYETASETPTYAIPAVPFVVPEIKASMPPNASLPSLAAFDSINLRPIFNPTRTPILSKPEGADTNTPLPPPNVILVGIIMDSRSRMAMVKTDSSPLAISVKEGAVLDGWAVSQISPDGIVLSAGTFTHSLLLNSNRPGAAAQSSNTISQMPRTILRNGSPTSPQQMVPGYRDGLAVPRAPSANVRLPSMTTSK